ncbi:unnamed protein product [Rhodiola kirilowii]
MSKRKEQKVNHNSKASQDIYEGTSARTRPYSFDEIMFNRKNKNLSQDHEIEAGGKENNLEEKSELLQTEKDDRSDKYSSHGIRNKNSENSMDFTLRKSNRSSSVKVESLIVGKVGVFSVEPKVKSEVVDGTRNKATLDISNAHSHKKTKEDERPCSVDEDTVGYSHSKHSSLNRRNEDYHIEKSEKDVKRKERNPTDQKINNDYLKAENKRKVKYSEGKDRFSGEVGKTGRENKTVHKNESDKGFLNKYGVSKRDSELSERRERRDSPPPLREQPSKRRRRSSSRERKTDRDQKLNSHEAQKHTSHHRQNYTVSVSSANSRKDRSGKNASELDRNTKFSNGSTGHHKGQNESSDKLGGYSPRKRRTEDPIQSPPAKSITGKKRLGWDTPHTESDIILSSALLPMSSFQSKPSNRPNSGGVLAVSSSQLEPSLRNLNDQSAMPIIPIDSVQLTQSTQPMRRLIIENVPSSASEKDVMDCFNKFLLPSSASFIQGTQPCISCVIHKEKRQSLVEFLTPEYASAALSFKGCPLLGFAVKIRRPKEFVETAVDEKSVASVNAVSDFVEDSSHKIFIGGISRNLSPQMLMEIACAFGPLKAYKFLFKNDLDEPRAFLQYVDHSITAKACAGLNGMKLGGQTLTVIQATTDKPSYDMERFPVYEIPETAKPLLADPTEVLLLKNVFDPENFSSLPQPEIEEVLEDVRLECTRFGTVKSINVITCNQSSIAPSEIIECDAAKLVLTESIGYGNDSGELNTEVGSSKQMAEEDYVNDAKSDNLNAEEPSSVEVVESDNVDVKEKPIPSDDTSNEASSTKTEVANKPSNLIDEMGDPLNHEAEGNSGGELNIDGENKQPIRFSAEPGCSIGTTEEAAEKNRGTRQVDGLHSVLLPGSICVEYRRSQAACLAAHCFSGRAFDNRIVSAEYISLDLYRRKFPK